MQNLLKSMERGSKLLTGSAKQRLDKMFTKVIVQQDLPLQVGESDTMHDFLLEVSQVRYKGVSAGTVRAIVADMSEEGKEQTKIFVARCVEGGTRLGRTLGYEYRIHGFRRGLCRRGRPASNVHASPTGAQRHRPSDVVEAASARVAGLGPNG